MQTPPTARASLIEMHRRFCELLPEDLLFMEDPKSREPISVVPGQLRERYVQVGRHIPPSPGAVPRFLERLHRSN